MFSVNSLKDMGISPKRCKAKAELYRSMAINADEESYSSSDRLDGRDRSPMTRGRELSGSMRDGEIGYLFKISAECFLIMGASDGYTSAASAGEAYLKAGVPYGLIFSVTFGNRSEQFKGDWREFFTDSDRYGSRSASSILKPFGREDMRLEAMKRPEQMVWLFLAAINTEGGSLLLSKEYDFYRPIMDARGHLPVGPLGIPVSAHLRLFDSVREGEKTNGALDEIFSVAMGRRSEVLSLAKRNSYLWERVRSPVALFDFHIFAMANAAVIHGILNEQSLSKMYSSLDEANPLLPLIKAPIKMAFDRRPDLSYKFR